MYIVHINYVSTKSPPLTTPFSTPDQALMGMFYMSMGKSEPWTYALLTYTSVVSTSQSVRVQSSILQYVLPYVQIYLVWVGYFNGKAI